MRLLAATVSFNMSVTYLRTFIIATLPCATCGSFERYRTNWKCPTCLLRRSIAADAARAATEVAPSPTPPPSPPPKRAA